VFHTILFDFQYFINRKAGCFNEIIPSTNPLSSPEGQSPATIGGTGCYAVESSCFSYQLHCDNFKKAAFSADNIKPNIQDKQKYRAFFVLTRRLLPLPGGGRSILWQHSSKKTQAYSNLLRPEPNKRGLFSSI